MRIYGQRLVLGLVAAAAVALPFAGTALSHDGTISTVAGTGTGGSSGDLGLATLAQLNDPQDVAALPGGGFLVADTANHVVRKVGSLGIISRVAGTGADGVSGDGGFATMAAIGDVSSVSPTADGGFLIADPDGHVVRKVSELGVIETVAGTGVGGYNGDGIQATQAQLNAPTDAVELKEGEILIAERGGNRIRKVMPNGVIETVAGNGLSGFSGDGGPAASAQVDDPSDISVIDECEFLFVDEANDRIRRVDSDGTISTVAGGGDPILTHDDPATEAYIRPVGVTALADGGFLVADRSDNRVHRVDPDGDISTEAGTGASGSGGDGGLPADAELNAPMDVSASYEGGYYIADSGNHKIRFVWTYDVAAGTDVTPPDKPEIKRGPGKLGNDPSPMWQFKVDGDVVMTDCKLKRGSTVVYDWERCTSPKKYDLRGKPDGVYTFFVDGADAAGNWSETATDRYELDQTPPATPVIGEAPPEVGSDSTPTFGFSGDEGATFRCELERDGRTILDDPCTSPITYELAEYGAGTYGFAVKAFDAVGNRSDPARATFVFEVGGKQLAPPEEPAPELGKTVVVESPSGTALVKVPGSNRWVELSDVAGLPMGSQIDARNGVARLSAALDGGQTQTASFRGGVFEVRQSARGMTDIFLRGRLRCGRASARPGAALAAAKRRSRRSRRLWASDDGGRWRTHGQNSVATVRGTRWLTEDRCGGTLTRVSEGAVVVRDKRTGRRVRVDAGEAYLARGRRP
jgi:NHL repeat